MKTPLLYWRWMRKSVRISRKLTYSSKDICKKDLSHPLQQSPTVQDTEKGWYEWWEKNNFFKKTKSKSKFVMMLPPPNITGKLHIGHALTCALQDALVRWHNMNDFNVTWIPGCDHAGIATQVVVEKHLWDTQKLTRHDLGREQFLKEVHKWKEENGDAIYSQMKRMGVALDWEKSFFTLDEKISNGVIEAFKRLFEDGLIYRGSYMINWCCALQSAISDFEVDFLEIEGPTQVSLPGYEKPVTFGFMYEVKYKVLDSDEMVVIATTRPETCIGDTALMIHPEDPRYSHLRGKFVSNPFTGAALPIIADERVLRDFGTGVVKVTPSHSIVDFEVSQRHNLRAVEVIDDKGLITGHIDFEGMPRFIATEKVLDYLAAKGLYDGCKKTHKMKLPVCSRSGDVIEYRLKEQWFLSTQEMADKATDAVSQGHIKLHPSEFSKIWNHFLSDRRDWCISRQLWWGHQIPVYWVSLSENSVFGSKEEENRKESTFVAASNKIEARIKGANVLGVEEERIKFMQQETDVLDTWFSSGILPFVINGWPHWEKDRASDSNDFTQFPLSLMETGHDILFFWVARMVMLSQQLTGQLPFKDVLLHGLVCDASGQKMSKSKGNVIDPLHIIEGVPKNELKKNEESVSYGADALRFSLCSLDVQNHSVPLDMSHIDHNRRFRNKMWQTIRFIIQNLEKIPDSKKYMENQRERVDLVFDRWILSRLSEMVTEAQEGFKSLEVNRVANGLKKFWYDVLCDVYLETCKPRLWHWENDVDSTRVCLRILWSSCHTGLLILAPLMPFLTEELYQRLPSTSPKQSSIHQCSYPQPEEWEMFRDLTLEKEMNTLLSAVTHLRGIRKAFNITSKKSQGKGSIFINDEALRHTALKVVPELQRICFLSEISVLPQENFEQQVSETGLALQPVAPGVNVQLHLQGLIDPAQENDRLTKKLAKLQKQKGELLKRIEKVEKFNKESAESLIYKLKFIEEEVKFVSNQINIIKTLT